MTSQKKNRGLSLVEMFIASLASLFVLMGVYKVTTSTTKATANSVSKALLERNAAEVQRRLTKMIGNLGYNPGLAPFKMEVSAEDITADDVSRRIGIHRANVSSLLWGSNDNILTGCDKTDEENCNNNTLQPSELYGVWLTQNVGANEPVADFGGGENLYRMKIRTFNYVSSAKYAEEEDLCMLANAKSLPPIGPSGTVKNHFEKTYKLVALTKDLEAENPIAAPTKESVLADNVLCLEFRYYRRGNPEACRVEDWTAVCGDESATPGATCTGPVYTYAADGTATLTTPGCWSPETPCKRVGVPPANCLKENDWERIWHAASGVSTFSGITYVYPGGRVRYTGSSGGPWQNNNSTRYRFFSPSECENLNDYDLVNTGKRLIQCSSNKYLTKYFERTQAIGLIKVGIVFAGSANSSKYLNPLTNDYRETYKTVFTVPVNNAWPKKPEMLIASRYCTDADGDGVGEAVSGGYCPDPAPPEAFYTPSPQPTSPPPMGGGSGGYTGSVASSSPILAKGGGSTVPSGAKGM